MRIIRNYFLREFTVNLISAFVGITFFLLLGNLIKALDFIVRKGVDANVALQSFMYTIPYLLQYSLPLSALLGILICMGRFGSDNEFVAIKVAGIGMAKILRIFLTFGCVFTLFLIYLHVSIIPHSHYMSKKIIKELGKSNPVSMIEPGIHVDCFDGFVLFTQDMDGNILKNVYIYQTQKNGKTNLIYAQRGDFIVEDNFLKINLTEGFVQGPAMQYRIKFENHFMNIPIDTQKQSIKKKIKHLGLKEIIRELKPLKDSGDALDNDKEKKLLVELNRKLSLSFASIIFIILGFGISGQMKIREKSINLSVIFITGLGYYLLSLLCTSLVIKDYLPVAGIWGPNLIFFLIGIFYCNKTCNA